MNPRVWPRRAVLLGAIAVATGCGPANRSDPGASSSGSDATSGRGEDPSGGVTGDPTMTPPAWTTPAAMAEVLATGWRHIVAPDSSAAARRAAGEHRQLALRVLGSRPDPQRRQVLDALPASARRATRADLRAGDELDDLGETPTRLPDSWRIIEPRPAEELLGHYRRTQRVTGIGWEYLASINLTETRMGRIDGTSTANAQGPMQFIPATWDRYGAGGDIEDPADAIGAAGRLLADHGGGASVSSMREALWHYNPSSHYLNAVLAQAGVMRRNPRSYHGYHAWRVFYRHTDGTYLLPAGYPDKPAELLPKL